MKYALLYPVFFLFACQHRADTQQNPVTDTAAFLDPLHAAGKEMPGAIMMGHSILIDGDSLLLRINQEECALHSYDAISKNIAQYSAAIQKQRFYVFYTNATAFTKTAAIINLLRKNGITNYRAFDATELMVPLCEPAADTNQ